MAYTAPQLQILLEMDERMRQLERQAASGDLRAAHQLNMYRLRVGLDTHGNPQHKYLKSVRAFCVECSDSSWFTSRHLTEVILDVYFEGNFSTRDIQPFDMEDVGGGSSICFVDRRNRIPNETTQIVLDPNNERIPPWIAVNLSAPAICTLTPVQAWYLPIWHFGSTETAATHYAGTYIGTQRRLATKKLADGTIGLSSQNPPTWPKNKKGFPIKSTRQALKWAQTQIPKINSVGVLQGPELPINRQYLFVAR